MTIELAKPSDLGECTFFDSHIPSERLEVCIKEGCVFVLKNEKSENTRIAGVLRYSLFWQTIPFLDLIFLDESHRGCGHGRQMMEKWEESMKQAGFKHVMTSTQSDEDAWKFYEKLGYKKAGGFFPPEQDAEEIIYIKELEG